MSRDHVADSILDRLARANWTATAIDMAIIDYAKDLAVWDHTSSLERGNDTLRGLKMLRAIRDERLDREAFRRRFVYREGITT